MPVEIVVVRHGQCTGNVADRASFKGNHDLFTRDIREQDSAYWPLTEKGIFESALAGKWIRDNVASKFDHYFVSDYVRAVQTAELMGFHRARWVKNVLLRERDWGGAENLPYPERNSLFEKMGVPLSEDSIFWKPPKGESMHDISKNIRSFFEMLSRIASMQRVLIVSHGAPMQAVRVLQHGITPDSYTSFIGNDYLRNCHIFHYTSKKDEANGISMYSVER